jgi:hippurate hydrolase
VLDSIKRIVAGEALAAGATREPEVELIHGFPAVVNDGSAISRLRTAFTTLVGDGRVFDPGVVTGSEDVGLLAEAAGAPCGFWLLGGSDPQLFEGADTADEITEITKGLPSNHSPQYAPVIEPTLGTGVAALVTAARTWLTALSQS